MSRDFPEEYIQEILGSYDDQFDATQNTATQNTATTIDGSYMQEPGTYSILNTLQNPPVGNFNIIPPHCEENEYKSTIRRIFFKDGTASTSGIRIK